MTTCTHQVPRIQGISIKNGKAIVYGIPAEYSFLPEDHPDQHNCDEMGCGQAHVLWRGQTDEALENAAVSCQHDRLKPGCTLKSVDCISVQDNTWRFICSTCREQLILPIGIAALKG